MSERYPWQRTADERVSAEQIKLTDSQYDATRYLYISSHSLADFDRDPAIYKAKLDGRIPDSDSPAYAFGRAAHCYILEQPCEFDKRYEVGDGPINPRTGKPFGRDTQKFAEWITEVRATGREPITCDEYERLSLMYDAVTDHPEVGLRLELSQVEQTIVAVYREMALRGRLDAICFNDERIWDLKTTGDLDGFERDFHRYGYARQMAFYRRLVYWLTGKWYGVSVVAVEKSAVPRCGVWQLTESTLDDADRQNLESLHRLRECIDRDHYPSAYANLRFV